jgi:hypothetical protein
LLTVSFHILQLQSSRYPASNLDASTSRQLQKQYKIRKNQHFLFQTQEPDKQSHMLYHCPTWVLPVEKNFPI